MISMARRIHAMWGESRTRVIVSGVGTELTKPARSMVSWSEGLFVDAGDWSGIVWGRGRCWLHLGDRNEVVVRDSS